MHFQMVFLETADVALWLGIEVYKIMLSSLFFSSIELIQLECLVLHIFFPYIQVLRWQVSGFVASKQNMPAVHTEYLPICQICLGTMCVCSFLQLFLEVWYI